MPVWPARLDRSALNRGRGSCGLLRKLTGWPENQSRVAYVKSARDNLARGRAAEVKENGPVGRGVCGVWYAHLRRSAGVNIVQSTERQIEPTR